MRHHLQEGLIKVPSAMLEEAEFYLTFYVLWWARDRFKGKAKALPEHYRAFKKLVNDFGEALPAQALDKSKVIQAHKIKTTTQGLPSNYQHLTPWVPYVWFVVDWRQGLGCHGVWRPNVGEGHGALAVYPMTLDYLSRYPEARSHPDDLEVALTTMRETIAHELRHMVQSVFLRPYPEQSEVKTHYAKNGKDYYTSAIEFDPTIGSVVNEFIHLWTIYSSGRRDKNMPLSRAVRQFTGLEKTGQFDTFTTSKFFWHMKNTSPVRYRKAIKKFVIELETKMPRSGRTPGTDKTPPNQRPSS